MEFSFNKLKKLDVISISDGKNLGRLCDVTFTLPEGKIKGFTSTGCKGFKLGKSEIFIPLSDIVKVGEDAILVKTGDKPPKPPCPPKRDKDDNCDCKPPHNPCKPHCPPDPCNSHRPSPDTCSPCNSPCDGRRNFDDYE
ncbi:MAG: PRC-barrel domain-containing protein [Candidatus Coproplasma sp.]